eukprot:4042882-Prymnesium_polylepis.1
MLWPLHMFTARGSPLSQEAQSAPQHGKVGCAAPNFFTFTPLQTPRGPLSAMATLGGVIPAGERWIRRRRDATSVHTAIPGIRKGVKRAYPELSARD